MAFAKAKLDDDGYVYETDANGNCTAIVFTGTVFDGTPDGQGRLLDDNDNVISENWRWHGAMRLEGDALAAIPPANPATDGQPTDPRFQAIMGWLENQVKVQYNMYAAIKAAEIIATARPSAEVAALPTITSLPG